MSCAIVDTSLDLQTVKIDKEINCVFNLSPILRVNYPQDEYKYGRHTSADL
jgi:hypothetical protein